MREAFSAWLQRRYGLTVDAGTQVLPVNGSREALFAFAQTVVDGSRPGATVLCPNPFYQIYEGRRAAGWRERGLRQLGPGAQLRGPTGPAPARGLGAHAVDLRLLARQPEWRCDAAG